MKNQSLKEPVSANSHAALEAFNFLVNIIFNEADKSRDGKIDKRELYGYALKSQQLQLIVEESIRSIRRIDKIIENDLQEPFNQWAPSMGM